jgi:ABC-type uncharacterized transport system permease subunit
MELLASLSIIGYILSTLSIKNMLIQFNQKFTHILFCVVLLLTIILTSIYTYNLALSHSMKLNFIIALLVTSLILNYLFFVFIFTKPIKHLGLILFPLTISVILFTLFFNFEKEQMQVDNNIILHIVVSIVSYGFLGLAAIQAILLKYQEYKLKNIQNSSLNNILPSIERMEKVMFELIILGFILLTLSLLSGAPFVVLDNNENLLQKITFSIIAWITYFYLLFKKFSSGVRGRQATNLALGGMMFLFISYLGTKIFFV